jgi:hypothetical protein
LASEFSFELIQLSQLRAPFFPHDKRFPAMLVVMMVSTHFDIFALSSTVESAYRAAKRGRVAALQSRGFARRMAP